MTGDASWVIYFDIRSSGRFLTKTNVNEFLKSNSLVYRFSISFMIIGWSFCGIKVAWVPLLIITYRINAFSLRYFLGVRNKSMSSSMSFWDRSRSPICHQRIFRAQNSQLGRFAPAKDLLLCCCQCCGAR